MTLYEFNSLTLEEKQITVWDEGIFLDNHITREERINCYAIDKFFVEVVFDGQISTMMLLNIKNYLKLINSMMHQTH